MPQQKTEPAFEIVSRALYADRRALSEAWYSALHLVQQEKRSPKGAPRREAVLAQTRRMQHALHGPAASPHGAVRGVLPAPSRCANALAGEHATAERRRSPARLAARIVKTFAKSPRAGATFEVDHGGQRVRVMVRSDGKDVRLLAICRPTAREAVARALDEARFALGAAGLRVHAVMKEGAA